MQVADGATYSTISGSTVTGTITVYSEQITNNANGGHFFSASDSTLNGLFSTNDSVFDEGVGIAPYNPVEGTTSSFACQDGITDAVTTNDTGCVPHTTDSTHGNILVLKLGSDIAAGTTLQFLVQAGFGASTDVVSDYWSTSVSGPNVSPDGMTLNGTTTAGQISTNGTTPQSALTLTKQAGIEWVAIEADCHYILLDTIKGSTPGVPEPRFYGMLLAGLLGLAGMVYQRRRAAQANA